MKRVYLTVYRGLGFTFLLGITVAIITFFFLMLFFAVNSKWVVPTHLSPSGDKMLAFNSAYQHALQNVTSVSHNYRQAQINLKLAQQRHENYSRLLGSLNGSMKNLQTLSANKASDLRASRAISVKLKRNQAQIDQALMAGLITSQEAAEQRAAAQNFDNSLTDSSISVSSALFAGASGVTQVAMQVAQAKSDIAIYRAQVESAQALLYPAQKQLTRLQRSAYFNAYRSNGADFAFIPYENLDKASVNQPVYGCAMLVLFCHQVGTINTIYNDEQIVDFPIFNVKFARTMRGTIIGLTIDPEKRSSMGDKLLFIGGKPLLF